jgi:hypothetical protein
VPISAVTAVRVVDDARPELRGVFGCLIVTADDARR